MGPTIDLRQGDCLEVMGAIPDGSVDAVVTDPPAGIAFMGKAWDGSRGGRDQWIGWLAERMTECLRLARPGAHALVWALPRTSHWTALALEDAGWTIEDRIAHVFGQGFPKHKSKLKPAVEDWWLCTKPGGAKWLNVDGCRVAIAPDDEIYSTNPHTVTKGGGISCDGLRASLYEVPAGRWPTNLVLTHHPDCNGSCAPGCPVAEMDRQSGERRNGGAHTAAPARPGCFGIGGTAALGATRFAGDSGGASRFFPTFAYCPKASRADRGEGNTHPTVKPLALMRWLCRLVTPAGGTILDPFLGSGTTAKAARLEGFGVIGIESDPDYLAIAQRRIDAELSRYSLLEAVGQ